MKHALKSRATCLVTLLATTAALAGCSKETPPEEAPHRTKTTVYATAQNKVLGAGATYYFPTVMPGFTTTEPDWYQIGISLTEGRKDGIRDWWVSNDTLFIKKTFEPRRIVGIDVILLTDYDKEHLKGGSIADQFHIETAGQPAMDMTEYFETYGSLDWREGQVCLLIAKTLPSFGYNETEFFDLPRPTTSGHRGFGALLRLTLEDDTVIETHPSIKMVGY